MAARCSSWLNEPTFFWNWTPRTWPKLDYQKVILGCCDVIHFTYRKVVNINMLIIRKSIFGWKITEHRTSHFPFINSLQNLGCGSKQNMLVLATLRYSKKKEKKNAASEHHVGILWSSFKHPPGMGRIKNRKFWQLFWVIMRDGNSTSDLSWLDSIKKLRKGRLGGNICLLDKEWYITFFFLLWQNWQFFILLWWQKEIEKKIRSNGKSNHF